MTRNRYLYIHLSGLWKIEVSDTLENPTKRNKKFELKLIACDFLFDIVFITKNYMMRANNNNTLTRGHRLLSKIAKNGSVSRTNPISMFIKHLEP